MKEVNNNTLVELMDKVDHIHDTSHLGNLEIHFHRSVRKIINSHSPLVEKARILSTFSHYINHKLKENSQKFLPPL